MDGGGRYMEKDIIKKSIVRATAVSLCLLAVFIILNTKMKIIIPSYITIPILIVTNISTFQYLIGKNKK